MSKRILPFAPILLTQISEPIESDEYMAQLKYDGVRFVYTPEGQVFSRKLIPFPAKVSLDLPPGRYWEGEIFSKSRPCAEVSGLLQRKGEPLPPDVEFVVFDTFERRPYAERFEKIPEHLRPELATTLDAVPGYCDGIVYRNKTLNYYNGRSPWDYKLKTSEEWDTRIVEVIRQEVNTNPQEVDNLGYAKRSSAMEGKIPTDKVGAFRVRAENGVEFLVGSGIPRDWHFSQDFIGKVAVVRFTSKYPGTGLPRFPRLIEVRHEL